MRRFFTTRVRVVLLLAVLLAAGLTLLSTLQETTVPDMLVQGVLTPIRTGVSKLADRAERIYSYIYEYEALAAENAALKEQLARIQEDARYADTVARENERLRAMLELKETRDDFVYVDGYVISRSSTEWSSTFTINSGTSSGIEVGMCAITENGEVVGLVNEVGPNYAVIKSVMDPSLEISATIADSGYNGMVQGTAIMGLSGLLRMDYLPSSAVIRNNDQVVTSGSTVYPRNLVLGYVVDADFDDAGIAKYAILKPAIDVGSLEQVFVITEYDAG